ncbi:ScbR family autoregulator-binding transcription factor [Mycobacterium sp. 852002-51961_SCH5331710]|uniref:ScbR family autoregulator-binding transcription factor n=1 Tax=Mycobacterium sp. 852002-51961_SCH5331710 TaxID=1834105 RepID=UPI0007FF688D|nr:ScbR family autoregulator-binding transcription factor [Mycobacterium sp. 852002-51961_SCH5331710]OBB34761.1 TetR family transcriptional regulator [Mycobacterium sp. 852002-51961_SCH5331710]
MVRQARSEATRRRIIDAAVELFNEIGYPATSLGDIIERAEMTKGALYYHFDSKEALAAAIIDEGSATLFEAFEKISQSSAPALERIIHGCFVVADLLSTDSTARSATQLRRTFGEFSEATSRIFGRWLDEIATTVTAAIEEGDVRPDLNPLAVAETVVGAMTGAELLSSSASSGTDVLERLGRIWEVLLPAIATEESLSYFQQYLAREALRRSAPDPGDV